VLPIDWPVLFRQFTPGQEPPMLAELAAGMAKPAAAKAARRKLAQELDGVAPNRRRAAVAAFLHGEALKVLGLAPGVELDARQPLSELGLDSLMAVELRNAIAGSLDRTLPATLLFKHPALDGLTDFVMTQVGDGQVSDGQVSTASTDDVKDAEADALAALSDEEAKALLARELEFLSASGVTPEESGS
jgi:acyl carrier protein